jgi:peptidyl-prolyl cis-trans isomerase NIMA-interacting 1
MVSVGTGQHARPVPRVAVPRSQEILPLLSLRPMTKRWLAFLVAALFLGCGAGRGTEKGAGSSGKEPLSEKAQACLRDARAPREAKPGGPEVIVVSHILVRHAELERPEGATRSPGDACLQALAALDALKGGLEWDEAVKKYSDEKGATAGLLGRVRRDDLEPAFADAAFALDVDQLSYVVESKRGFHIIVRKE